VFERQRRILLSATMLACRGKLQKEGEVIHVIAEEIIDLSAQLRSVGDETRGIRPPTRDFR
jgi:error-prone DNA polymerase